MSQPQQPQQAIDYSEMTDEQVQAHCEQSAKEGREGITQACKIISDINNRAMAEIAVATSFMTLELAAFRELEILMKSDRLTRDRMNEIFNRLAAIRGKIAELAKQQASSTKQ